MEGGQDAKAILARTERERGRFDRDQFPWHGLGEDEEEKALQQLQDLEGQSCYMLQQANGVKRG